MHAFLKLFILVKHTVHVSDSLPVHHQELKTAHTATSICQRAAATCCQRGWDGTASSIPSPL